MYSPNLDVLVGESVDAAGQPERVGSNGYLDDLAASKRAKNSHYDSCDSDDYADSDN